jgi:hypothetical protein
MQHGIMAAREKFQSLTDSETIVWNPYHRPLDAKRFMLNAKTITFVQCKFLHLIMHIGEDPIDRRPAVK